MFFKKLNGHFWVLKKVVPLVFSTFPQTCQSTDWQYIVGRNVLSQGNIQGCPLPHHHKVQLLSRSLKLEIKASVPSGREAGARGHSGLIPSVWPPQRPSSGPLFGDTAPLSPAGPGAEASQQPSGPLSQQPPGPSPSWLRSWQNLCACHARAILCP